MEKTAPFWRTSVCSIQPYQWLLRGYDVTQLMGRLSYGAAIYLMLKGELPAPRVGRLMDALLVSSCDFGPLAPSVAAARYAASGRPCMSAAIAAGLLAIGEAHGGAARDAMIVFYRGMEGMNTTGKRTDEIAGDVIRYFKSQKKYIPGYGLPSELGPADPNPVVARRLYELAEKAGLPGRYMELSKAISRLLKVEINLDGALAAVLCELNFRPEEAESIFCLSRITGIACEVLEEFTREKPFRQTRYADVAYDGPALREMPPEYSQELL